MKLGRAVDEGGFLVASMTEDFPRAGHMYSKFAAYVHLNHHGYYPGAAFEVALEGEDGLPEEDSIYLAAEIYLQWLKKYPSFHVCHDHRGEHSRVDDLHLDRYCTELEKLHTILQDLLLSFRHPETASEDLWVKSVFSPDGIPMDDYVKLRKGEYLRGGKSLREFEAEWYEKWRTHRDEIHEMIDRELFRKKDLKGSAKASPGTAEVQVRLTCGGKRFFVHVGAKRTYLDLTGRPAKLFAILFDQDRSLSELKSAGFDANSWEQVRQDLTTIRKMLVKCGVGKELTRRIVHGSKEDMKIIKDSSELPPL